MRESTSHTSVRKTDSVVRQLLTQRGQGLVGSKGALVVDRGRVGGLLLDGGSRFGVLFETGSAASLADELIALLGDPQRLEGIARAGEAASLQYDWEVVADKVYEVYKLAIDTGSPAVSGSRSARNLIRGRGEEGR